MSKKKTIEEIKEIIEGKNGNGCKLLSTEYKNNKSPLDILCACGEPFKASLNSFQRSQKQCSKCGKEIGRLKMTNKIKCKCDYCNKEIEQIPSQYKNQKHHFCNKECHSRWMSKNQSGENSPIYRKIKCSCDYCGLEIKVTNYEYKNQKHHFCNTECYGKWCSKNRIAKNHPMFGKEGLKGKNNPKYNRIECKCDYCHKEISVSNYNYKKHKRNFCSTECHSKWMSENIKGKNHPSYNPNITDEEREKGRFGIGIPQWREEVYKRDKFTCQCCGDNHGGNLNAHHLNGYNFDKEHRTDINNGITLCKTCHKGFHEIYGYGDNTWLQFREFLYNKYLQTKDFNFLTLIEEIDLRFM